MLGSLEGVNKSTKKEISESREDKFCEICNLAL